MTIDAGEAHRTDGLTLFIHNMHLTAAGITIGSYRHRQIFTRHGKTQHTGKVAVQADGTVKKERKLQELKDRLNTCIAEQDYETCAKLRDEIRALEQEENV